MALPIGSWTIADLLLRIEEANMMKLMASEGQGPRQVFGIGPKDAVMHQMRVFENKTHAMQYRKDGELLHTLLYVGLRPNRPVSFDERQKLHGKMFMEGVEIDWENL